MTNKSNGFLYQAEYEIKQELKQNHIIVMIHTTALFISPRGHKFMFSVSYQQSELLGPRRSIFPCLLILFLLWIYPITTSLCMYKYMQEANTTFC